MTPPTVSLSAGTGSIPGMWEPVRVLDAYAGLCRWELATDCVVLLVQSSDGAVVRTPVEGAGAPAWPELAGPVTVSCEAAPVAGAVVAVAVVTVLPFADGSAEVCVLPRPGAVLDPALARDRLHDRLTDPGCVPPGPQETRRITSAPWIGDQPLSGCPDVCGEFVRQAAETPHVVAVQDDTDRLTYAELEQWTRRLARRLVADGVTAGEVVGVGVERGLRSVVATLAILRAGAAYLPIGVQLPPVRQRWYLTASGCRRAVVGSVSALAELADRVVPVDHGRHASAPESPASDLTAAADPERLAYVMFTSGSTGDPKAVAMPRRALNHHIAWYREQSRSVLRGRSLHFSELGWDTSTAEIFPALCAGGTVVVAGSEARQDPDTLVRLLRTAEVHRAILPPAVLSQVAERCLRSGGPPLALLDVVSGGEQLVVTDVLRRWLAELPGAVLQNHYGPTETQLVTAWVAEADEVEVADIAPIGRPCGLTRLYVLGEDGRPAAVGRPGELVIAGPGVGHGYLGDPAATAAAFGPDPDGTDRPAYRSGDMVRWLPDGNLQFLGRADRQVKIRGYRVELNEVEQALHRLPAVRSAAVTPVGSPGRRTLTAFVVAPDGPPAEQLRTALADLLPDFMVPARVVVVDSLPLTSNGKVDVAALIASTGTRSPDTSEPGRKVPVQAPTAPEVGPGAEAPFAALIDAWREVLGEPPGADDDFHSAGGDSLTAMSLANRCRIRGLAITARDVLTLRTPRRLTEAGTARTALAEPEPEPTGLLPLLPSQADAFRQRTDDRNVWYQASLFRTAGRLDTAALREALAAVVEAHPSLRCAVHPDGQRVLPRGEPVLGVAAGAGPDRLSGAMATVLDGGLDIAAGRLVNVTYLPPDRLLVVAHSMAFDMLSWTTFTGDLQEAYRALVESRTTIALGEPTRLLAWIEALRRYAAGSARNELPMWQAQGGAGTGCRPDVAGDPVRDNVAAHTAYLEVRLDRAGTARLIRGTPGRLSCRLDELLLHALIEVLDQGDGEPVRVDTLGHGRAETIADGLDLSRTTGWFTAVTPLTVELPRTRAFADRLAATVAANRARPAHGVGFGALRTYGDDDARARLARVAAADVSFDFLGAASTLYPGPMLAEVLPADLGPYVHASWQRPHLIEVQARVADGELVIGWMYSRALHREPTVRALAARHLRVIAEATRAAGGRR